MKKVENSMSEDFNKYPGLSLKEVRYTILIHNNENLYSMSCDINEFELTPKIIKTAKIWIKLYLSKEI